MFKVIQTSTTGILQTFGRFTKLVEPGIHFYIPIVQKITPVSNMTFQRSTDLHVVTRDNTYPQISVSYQYKVKPTDTEKAYFQLNNPDSQIRAYIEQYVRSQVPSMDLMQLQRDQQAVSAGVREYLQTKMESYGYTIGDVLITDVRPPEAIVKSQNSIVASENMKRAAQYTAEAEYIRDVRKAEADKARKILQGEGVSGQRAAILNGYKVGVGALSSELGLTPAELIKFITEMQKLDTMESIGRSENAKVMFMNTNTENSTEQSLAAMDQLCKSVIKMAEATN